MILTREPDQESTGPLARRLRGNWACLPIPSEGVYWDNRFVILAKSSTESAQVTSSEVLQAALAPHLSQKELRNAIEKNTLYVRQLRKLDWEEMTSAISRVRKFNIPFECIRALPAVLEKGKNAQGVLCAAPHLGLSACVDVAFTAVRLPRFRCLPNDIEPGFDASETTLLSDFKQEAV